MELSGLVTPYGVPVTEELIRSQKMDPENVEIFSPHNHVRDNGEGSVCATTTIDNLLIGILNSPITLFSLTDHVSDFSSSNIQRINKKLSCLSKNRKFIPGFEARTQYDEFSVIGMEPEDIQELIESLFINGKFDHDEIMEGIRIHNFTEKYRDDKIVRGFNHPFSQPLIGNSLLSSLNMFGLFKNIRTGFNFQAYLFDHWPKKGKGDTVKSLGIDRFCSKYLLDKTYLESNPESNKKYATHEWIIQRLMDSFDYVEFNMINFYYGDNKKAMSLAKKYGKPLLVGEDSHHPHQIGKQGFNLIPKDMAIYEALHQNKVVPAIAENCSMNLGYLPSIQVIKDRGLSKKVKKEHKH